MFQDKQQETYCQSGVLQRDVAYMSKIPNQTFDELPFKEEILAFLRYLGHSGEIKKITDININKLHQLCRSFAAVINKCLSGKSTGYDSLRHQNIQQFNAMLSVELSNEDIRNSAAYKEYYASASGAAPLKTISTSAKGKQPTKLSKAKGLYALSEVALTEAEHIKLAIKKSLQQTHISQASGSGKDEGTGSIPGVLDVPTDEFDEEISLKSSDKDDDDDQSEAYDNDDDQDSDNDGDEFVHTKLNDDESHDMNVGGEEGPNAEDDDEELYRDVNINLEDRGSKRRREGKEPESTSTPKEKESKNTKPSHQEFETCAADDLPIAEASQHPEWLQKQTKPPTPDRAWNKTLLATHESIQPWISDLAKQADSRASFNELMDTW
nr:hypothetical protein [Tanacetum cinerariifolium]